jgi:membrane protease YdiL (CAAX protease family)
MPEEITPHATPITHAGEPEWFPPSQDDEIQNHRPEESGPRKIFYGRDGLRAGWAILLFAAFLFLFGGLLNKGLHLALHGQRIASRQPPEWFVMSGSALNFLVVALAGIAVSRIERRPFAAYGIGSTGRRLGEIATGTLMGFGALSVLAAILWGTGKLTYGGLRLHGTGSILLWALLFAISFVFTGLFEEFAFRGFLQYTLTRGIAGILRYIGMEDHAKAIGFWITAALLSFCFGAVHSANPGEGKIGLFAAGLIGLAFAFSLWRTGSLWWAIAFHAAWDWAESYFYGTADSGGVSPHRLMQTSPQGGPVFSGGTVGPEGSVWVFAVIALVFLLIAVTLKPRPGSPAAEFAAKP